ncbi:MAG: iron-sulfur cluster assembly protein [Anaerolineales bacterium]|nr:iron-sulfur cluster assembly protein [Anaerolineales bacterium]
MTEQTDNGVSWEADSTHPEQAARLREALRQVVDPEIGLNIIELGLIREVAIADPALKMRMILTTPFCPYGPAMLEMTRTKAQEASAMEVELELGMEMWDPSMMEGGAGAAWGF